MLGFGKQRGSNETSVKRTYFGSVYVSGKLTTHPSPNLTLTLTSHFEQNVGLGEGLMVNFPETYIDPIFAGPLALLCRSSNVFPYVKFSFLNRLKGVKCRLALFRRFKLS